jgi:hypothetical protein
MNKQYSVSGKSTTLKEYADVYDTIPAIKRIVAENYPAVAELAEYLRDTTEEETFRNIWNYVKEKIRYQNDERGKEQLRTPQRTIADKTGDCDDMSILISSMLINLGCSHELYVTAYKQKDQWQHIYPVAYDRNGKRYVIDCVPEIPYFNYEAQPIKNKIVINMKLEELGRGIQADLISDLTQPFDIDSLEGVSNDEELITIQGILGNIAIVDEGEEYDTMLSGSELKQNIVMKQLMDAKNALQKEVSSPTELSQLNDNKLDLQLVNNILENINDEEAFDEAIDLAIRKGTIYQNFYKTIGVAMDDAVNGLSGGDDDFYYLKSLNDDDAHEILTDEISGLGKGFLKKIGNKIKKGVQKFKENHPKIAKIANALNKFNPATFTIRKSMEPFIRANAFQMAEKMAVGYATADQAKNMGYTNAEWLQFVDAKDKAEQKWAAIGGEKDYFRKMIMNGVGAKKAGLKGLGIAPAILAVVTKVFGVVIDLFKKLKLKRKDGTVVEDNTVIEPESNTEPENTNSTKSAKTINNNKTMAENETNPNVVTDEKSGVTTETVTDDSGKTTTVYKDKDGNEIGKFKAFFLKNKTMIIIISIILVVGIIALIIWKIRKRSLNGLGEAGLSRKQENYIRRQGLNNRAYASLVREEIGKDRQPYNQQTRRSYYKKVFQDAFSRPLSHKQTTAALSHNNVLKEVRQLAKSKGGGSRAWKEAWSEVKKKGRK